MNTNVEVGSKVSFFHDGLNRKMTGVVTNVEPGRVRLEYLGKNGRCAQWFEPEELTSIGHGSRG